MGVINMNIGLDRSIDIGGINLQFAELDLMIEFLENARILYGLRDASYKSIIRDFLSIHFNKIINDISIDIITLLDTQQNINESKNNDATNLSDINGIIDIGMNNLRIVKEMMIKYHIKYHQYFSEICDNIDTIINKDDNMNKLVNSWDNKDIGVKFQKLIGDTLIPRAPEINEIFARVTNQCKIDIDDFLKHRIFNKFNTEGVNNNKNKNCILLLDFAFTAVQLYKKYGKPLNDDDKKLIDFHYVDTISLIYYMKIHFNITKVIFSVDGITLDAKRQHKRLKDINKIFYKNGYIPPVYFYTNFSLDNMVIKIKNLYNTIYGVDHDISFNSVPYDNDQNSLNGSYIKVMEAEHKILKYIYSNSEQNQYDDYIVFSDDGDYFPLLITANNHIKGDIFFMRPNMEYLIAKNEPYVPLLGGDIGVSPISPIEIDQKNPDIKSDLLSYENKMMEDIKKDDIIDNIEYNQTVQYEEVKDSSLNDNVMNSVEYGYLFEDIFYTKNDVLDNSIVGGIDDYTKQLNDLLKDAVNKLDDVPIIDRIINDVYIKYDKTKVIISNNYFNTAILNQNTIPSLYVSVNIRAFVNVMTNIFMSKISAYNLHDDAIKYKENNWNSIEKAYKTDLPFLMLFMGNDYLPINDFLGAYDFDFLIDCYFLSLLKIDTLGNNINIQISSEINRTVRRELINNLSIWNFSGLNRIIDQSLSIVSKPKFQINFENLKKLYNVLNLFIDYINNNSANIYNNSNAYTLKTERTNNHFVNSLLLNNNDNKSGLNYGVKLYTDAFDNNKDKYNLSMFETNDQTYIGNLCTNYLMGLNFLVNLYYNIARNTISNNLNNQEIYQSYVYNYNHVPHISDILNNITQNLNPLYSLIFTVEQTQRSLNRFNYSLDLKNRYFLNMGNNNVPLFTINKENITTATITNYTDKNKVGYTDYQCSLYKLSIIYNNNYQTTDTVYINESINFYSKFIAKNSSISNNMAIIRDLRKNQTHILDNYNNFISHLKNLSKGISDLYTKLLSLNDIENDDPDLSQFVSHEIHNTKLKLNNYISYFSNLIHSFNENIQNLANINPQYQNQQDIDKQHIDQQDEKKDNDLLEDKMNIYKTMERKKIELIDLEEKINLSKKDIDIQRKKSNVNKHKHKKKNDHKKKWTEKNNQSNESNNELHDMYNKFDSLNDEHEKLKSEIYELKNKLHLLSIIHIVKPIDANIYIENIYNRVKNVVNMINAIVEEHEIYIDQYNIKYDANQTGGDNSATKYKYFKIMYVKTQNPIYKSMYKHHKHLTNYHKI